MTDKEELEALRQFAHHMSERDRLQEVAQRARRDAAAHSQIMEGLARLYPSVMRAFREDATDRKSALERSIAISRPSPVPFLNQLRPTTEVRLEEARPTGIAALKEVLISHRGEFFTASQIHELLAQENLINPGPNSLRVLRNTLNRAVKSGSVVRREELDGVSYALRPLDLTEKRGSMEP
jgi:hypothetical protein